MDWPVLSSREPRCMKEGRGLACAPTEWLYFYKRGQMLKVTNGSSQFLLRKVTLNRQVSCLDNSICIYSASVRRHRDGQLADGSNGGREQH